MFEREDRKQKMGWRGEVAPSKWCLVCKESFEVELWCTNINDQGLRFQILQAIH